MDGASLLPRLCATCGITSSALKRCLGCGNAFYCDRECQRADWRNHKVILRNSKNLEEIVKI